MSFFDIWCRRTWTAAMASASDVQISTPSNAPPNPPITNEVTHCFIPQFDYQSSDQLRGYSMYDPPLMIQYQGLPPDTINNPLHRPSPPQNWEQRDIETLTQCFANLSRMENRSHAKDMLSELSRKPNYCGAVLSIFADPNVTDENIRDAASVNFLDQVKAHWKPEEEMKDLIMSLFESVEASFDRYMYHFASIILRVLDSIFMRFRYEFRTRQIMHELKFCVDEFADRLLFCLGSVFDWMNSLSFEPELDGFSLISLDDVTFFVLNHTLEGVSDFSQQHKTILRDQHMSELFECARLCCSIFFSWSFMELPADLEGKMDDWMTPQLRFLKALYTFTRDIKSITALALFDKLREAVCEIITLYVEKYGEEFQAYLNPFVKAVRYLLEEVSKELGHDQLVVSAFKFLIAVSKSVHHNLFPGDINIPRIFQNFILPNVKLRDEDMDLFDVNYMEFIKRDMEGSDFDSRRRIACELIKGIAPNFRSQVCSSVSKQIWKLLTSFDANPAENWKDKHCAIYMAVSFATTRAGVILNDVEGFLGNVIVPVLQSQDVNGYPPMLKAGALKFFTMNRNRIPKPMTLQLFPELIRCLRAESNVVHSYAAICIEKLLLVKDEGGQTIYTSEDISPLLPQLMQNLFEALKGRESDENQYIMKCIMRVLGVADMPFEIVGPFITELTLLLNKACEDTKNPVFKHYVFESMALLVKRACWKEATFISTFEVNLFPIIHKLIKNFQDPYGLQLLAVLVESSRLPIPESYMQIFPLLLSPEWWRKASKVPALVCLLQAFLQKAPHELNQEARLRQVLEISYKLVSDAKTEKPGFYVLNTVIQSLDLNVIEPYIGKIWISLFTLLQSRPTRKFITSLLVFMSLFVVKYGSTNLVDSVNGIQANLFLMILQQFWIPNLVRITGVIQPKLTAVASTRVLCESQVLQDEDWGRLLDGILTLLSQTEQVIVETDLEMPECAESVGYSATYPKLHNAGKTEDDSLIGITDAKEYLVTSLAALSKFPHDRFPQYVSERNRAELVRLYSVYCQNV